MDEHYSILGVLPSADHDDIKAAYRRLVKRWHPDVCNDTTQSTQTFSKILTAYQVLSTTGARERYDAQLNSRRVLRRQRFAKNLLIGALPSSLCIGLLWTAIAGGASERILVPVKATPSKVSFFSSHWLRPSPQVNSDSASTKVARWQEFAGTGFGTSSNYLTRIAAKRIGERSAADATQKQRAQLASLPLSHLKRVNASARVSSFSLSEIHAADKLEQAAYMQWKEAPKQFQAGPASGVTRKTITTASLKSGWALWAQGNVSAARQIFRSIANRGNTQAAIAMGVTYDPYVSFDDDSRAIGTNRRLALHWYRRAHKLQMR